MKKKKKNGIENGKPHTQFWGGEPGTSAHIRITNYK